MLIMHARRPHKGEALGNAKGKNTNGPFSASSREAFVLLCSRRQSVRGLHVSKGG